MPDASLLDLTSEHSPMLVTIARGTSLHVGRAPEMEPRHLAVRCGRRDFLTLTAHGRELVVACHSERYGAWLFELAPEGADDPRPLLRDVRFQHFAASLVAAGVGPDRDESARWIRTESARHRVGSRDGGFTHLAAPTQPCVVRAPAMLFLPGGHLYDLEPPVRASTKTSPQDLASSTSADFFALRARRGLDARLAWLRERVDGAACALIAFREGRLLAGELPDTDAWIVPAGRADATARLAGRDAFARWVLALKRSVPIVLRDLRATRHIDGVVAHAITVWEHSAFGRVALLRPLTPSGGTLEDAAIVEAIDDARDGSGRSPRAAPSTDPVAAAVAAWRLTSAPTAFAKTRSLYDQVIEALGPDASVEAVTRSHFEAARVAPRTALGRLAALALVTPVIDAWNPDALSDPMMELLVAAELHLLAPAEAPVRDDEWFRSALADAADGLDIKVSDDLLARFARNPEGTLSALDKNRSRRHGALRTHAILHALVAPSTEEPVGRVLRLPSGIDVVLDKGAVEALDGRVHAGLFNDATIRPWIDRMLVRGYLARALAHWRSVEASGMQARCATTLARLSEAPSKPPDALVQLLQGRAG